MSSKANPLEGHPRYEKVKDLNSGAFGFVVLARDKKTSEQVAIKFLAKGPKITKYVGREILNHSRLLHPHIVKFHEVFLTHDYLAIVMEFAGGGDMFQYVKARGGLEEPEARWFFQQLILGMDYCHKMGVVNRDIKLENTLLDGSRRPLLKICDFGYSKNDKDSLPKSKVGTPGYTAPEVINGSRTYNGQAADVWSAGVMLYVMLFCEYPFERPEDRDPATRFQKVVERIQKVDYRFPDDIPASEECKDLIRHILVADVDKRYTIKQILDKCLHLQGAADPSQTEDAINQIVAKAANEGAHARRNLDAFDDDFEAALEEEMGADY